MDGQTPRKSWKRRLVRALALCLLLAVAAVGALPWLLCTPPARSALVAAVNRVLAPSRVAVRGVSASWLGPIKLTGLTLRNAKGKVLIDAHTAAIDRGLIALALDHNRLGTVTLDGAAVDIERRPDGSIDLVEALVPQSTAPKPSPTTKPAAEAPAAGPGVSVTVRVARGSVRLSSPELAEPLVAGSMDIEATLPAGAREPLTWKVRLARPDSAATTETLGVDGTFDHRAATDPDLSLTVKGERWPLALAGAAVTVRARLDGGLTLRREAGRWVSSGDARLLDLDASGPALAGDRLRLDGVSAGWDLAQTAGAWQVRRLGLRCPLAELTGQGSLGPGGDVPAARLQASVDLAALAKQVPHALRLREGLTLERGSARLNLAVAGEKGTQTASVDAALSELAARHASGPLKLDPATLSARASRSASGFSVQALTVKASFAELNGSGDLERGVTLSGSLDLGALEAHLRDLIDFGGVQLAGKLRMAGDYRQAKAPAPPKDKDKDKTKPPAGPAFVARYAAEVRGLKVAGLTADPVERDSARFEAVVTGPVDGTGLPRAWENLRFNLKSSRDAVTVGASTRDGTTRVNASASVPVKVAGRDGQATALAVGRWTPGPGPGEGVAEFDELRLGLRPADPALAADGTLALAVRGKLDLTRDDLALTPLPLPAGTKAVLAVAPEGVAVHGLRKTPAAERNARVNLVGDLGAADRALAVWTAQPPNGLDGHLSATVVLAPAGSGRLSYAVVATTPDVSRPGPDGHGRKPEGPLTLACDGTYQPGSDRLEVADLALVTRYAGLTASGRLDEPTGRRAADLRGTLTPNWPVLSATAAEAVEPGMRLTGGPRPFRVKGPLSGGSLAAVLKGLDAEVGLDLASADAFGLKLGPAPVVVRCGEGQVTIDPVHTTLNGGRVDLLPGLDVDEARGIALTLAQGSAIDGAAINDEVSKRVLRYVAPVLDKATHVNGKVSMTVDRADIPVASCPPDRRLSLTGKLEFQDVVFAPGPFASEVLTLAGQPNAPGLKLQQPVQLAVADGRVIQKGLEVPVGRGSSVALEGSVGFDQTLDLKASVPLSKAMLGPAGNLAGADLRGLVDGRRVVVPIGGTVEHPKVNRQALQVALRQLSRDVLKGGLSQEASGLLDRIAPQRGPDPGQSPGAGAGTGQPQGDPLKALENEALRRLLPRGGRQP
jgi:translocation and assembly module TamB